METSITSVKPARLMQKIMLFVMSILVSIVTFAKDATKKVDVDISTDNGGGSNFFASPWVWVVGIAVFILLLVALLRGGGRKEV